MEINFYKIDSITFLKDSQDVAMNYLKQYNAFTHKDEYHMALKMATDICFRLGYLCKEAEIQKEKHIQEMEVSEDDN